MRNGWKYALTLLLSLLLLPAVTTALERQPRIESEIVMKAGEKVHLLHRGAADVRQQICLNDTIPVYRELMAGGHTKIDEVGQIKVLDYMGEDYFVAEVVEGEIKVGDLAKKTTPACVLEKVG